MSEIQESSIEAGQEQKEKPRKIVLEVGCGDRPHFLVNRLGYREIGSTGYYIGMDIEGKIQTTKKYLEDQGIKGDVIQADAEGRFFPFRDGSVDEVILADILSASASQSNERIKKIFDEADRVLKPGGKILIIEDCFPYNSVIYEEFIGSLGVRENYFVSREIIRGQPERSRDFYPDRELPQNDVVVCIKRPPQE